MVFKALASLFSGKPEAPALDASSPARNPTPDTPVFLPSKTGWLAIPTSDQKAVTKALGLLDLKVTNWASGVEWSSWYSERHFSELWWPCFVTPPIDGWILVRGVWLGDTGTITRVVQTLSKAFGRAFYFMTMKTTEDHAWAFALGGQLQRLAYFNEGIAIAHIGAPTPEEAELGLDDLDALNTLRTEGDDEAIDDATFVDETIVDTLAGRWTISPMLIDIGKVDAPGTGLGGIIKL